MLVPQPGLGEHPVRLGMHSGVPSKGRRHPWQARGRAEAASIKQNSREMGSAEGAAPEVLVGEEISLLKACGKELNQGQAEQSTGRH